MTKCYTCRCGEPAVTELVPFLGGASAGRRGANSANSANEDTEDTADARVVYVFPYWCPACFAAKFAPLVRAEMTLRQAVGMARARDMIQRERWTG